MFKVGKDGELPSEEILAFIEKNKARFGAAGRFRIAGGNSFSQLHIFISQRCLTLLSKLKHIIDTVHHALFLLNSLNLAINNDFNDFDLAITSAKSSAELNVNVAISIAKLVLEKSHGLSGVLGCKGQNLFLGGARGDVLRRWNILIKADSEIFLVFKAILLFSTKERSCLPQSLVLWLVMDVGPFDAGWAYGSFRSSDLLHTER